MSAPASAPPPDWDAIARYLAGESSAEETASVRAWLDANPLDRAVIERIDELASVEPAADIDVEAALASMHRRMAQSDRPALRVERGGARLTPAAAPARMRRIVIVLTTAAAAVAAFALLVRRSPEQQPGPATTFATGVGQRDSVRLSDGSVVVLGPQSTLEVSQNFDVARAVRLTGDAYFDVKHDAAKPFTVRAGSALIEDIGTTFTIDSDTDGNRVASVSVVEGSVRLRRDSTTAADGVVLAAGDRGWLTANGETTVERNVVGPEDVAWVTGGLSFRDAPLSRVIAEMERWYGLTLRVEDSAMLRRHVTTSFEGESADQALRILGLTLGATIERRGESAVISVPRGSTTPR
jgi:transmembrane sensor